MIRGAVVLSNLFLIVSFFLHLPITFELHEVNVTVLCLPLLFVYGHLCFWMNQRA